jgi:hypothetical protein
MHDNDYDHDLQDVNACLTPRCYSLLEVHLLERLLVETSL